jgi:hypothetical protein
VRGCSCLAMRDDSGAHTRRASNRLLLALPFLQDGSSLLDSYSSLWAHEHEGGGIGSRITNPCPSQTTEAPLRYRRTDSKPAKCAGGLPESSIASRAGAQPERVLTLNIVYRDSEEVPCEEYVRFTQTKSLIVEDNTQ